MDIFLMIVAGLFLLVGLLGNILPGLPGVPLSYIGLLLLHFTDKVQFSATFLLVWAGITVLTIVLDYLIPAWGTKQFGGSRWGVWGSTIGLVIGLFLGPWGIIARSLCRCSGFRTLRRKECPTGYQGWIRLFHRTAYRHHTQTHMQWHDDILLYRSFGKIIRNPTTTQLNNSTT